MSNVEPDESGRRDELRQKLYQTLFPGLSPEEAQAQFEKALRRQKDDAWWEGMEDRLKGGDLYGDLLATLYELRESQPIPRD